MFVIWILLILFTSYLISLSAAASIKVDTSLNIETVLEKTAKRSRLMHGTFWTSSLVLFSIWGANYNFNPQPKNPFTPNLAAKLIAADDDEKFVGCVNSFSGIGDGKTMMSLKGEDQSSFSVSEVKLVCTCIKEKYKKTRDYKLYTDLVYWKDCTSYCQTDSCDAGKEYFKNEYEEVAFELGKLLYPP